ncbi:MAG: uncharacterized protein JWP87_2360 [Labilithrix sp.]|nr:uncharacterized protein [Labilithrix sp.]
MDRNGLGILIGGSRYVRASTGLPFFSLDLLDLENIKLRTIDVTFLPHGFATMPGRDTTAAVFEKRGPNAAVIELLEGKVRPIAAGPGRAFYGHGLFSPDAKQIYAVEIDTDTHEGLLSVRDADTFEVTGEIATDGKNPHDALLLDDGTTLVVTNGGGELGSDAPASVAFIDLPSRRVVDRVLVADEQLNAGHVAVGTDGTIAVVSAPRDGLPGATSLGGMSLRRAGERGGLERLREPDATTKRMIGESLSVCIHEKSGVVAATHPFGGLLTLWNLAERKLLRSFEMVSARGVTLTLDGRYFAVSHGLGGSLSLIDPTTQQLVKDETMEIGRLTGSHIYAWSLPAGVSFS